MENETKALLKKCNQGAKMAMNGLDTMVERAQSEDFVKLLDGYKCRHGEIADEMAGHLQECGGEAKAPSEFMSAMTDKVTRARLAGDGSDGHIAKMLIKSSSEGCKKINEYIEKYPDADDESKLLAQRLSNLSQDFIKDLAHFV